MTSVLYDTWETNLVSVIQEFYLNAWDSLWLSSYISKQKHPKFLMKIQLKAGTGYRIKLKKNKIEMTSNFD